MLCKHWSKGGCCHITLGLSCQKMWVQGLSCHFLRQGTWVRRRYCRHIYICVCVCVYVCVRMCVKIYKNKTFHTHIIHAYLIFLNSMIHMNSVLQISCRRIYRQGSKKKLSDLSAKMSANIGKIKNTKI